MPRPKKVEKQKKEEVVLDLRQDREEFLRAFEKPTQIYRFLRARHCISPIFLHRNLLYMLGRCSRNNGRRKLFHVDDMLSKNEYRSLNCNNDLPPHFDQLKIVISGFYIDPGVNHENIFSKKLSDIDAEVLIRKIYRSRRKDGDSIHDDHQLGVAEVAVNPRNPDVYVTEPIYLYTSHHFQSPEGQTIKNYTLIFRIHEPFEDSSDVSSDSSDDMQSEDGSISDSICGEGRKRKLKDDPAAISLKNLTSGSRRRQIEKEGKCDDEDERSTSVTEPPRKIKKLSNEHYSSAIYEAELDIFTSDKRTVLIDGDYELSLNRKFSRGSDGRKNATWESLDGGREIKVLSAMTNSPVLKFNLSWSECDKPGPLAETPTKTKAITFEPDAKRARKKISTKTEDEIRVKPDNGSSQNPPKFLVDSVNYRKDKISSQHENMVNGEEVFLDVDSLVVYYQFIYNNERQQQTEARDDLHCPWCQLNCITLYGLIKHLKMTHPRFHFTYSTHNQGCCIEVSVNECYDGSYCGNPQFVYSQPGMAFSRRGPVRRTPVTDTLFFRSKQNRRLTRLNPKELLEKEENEAPPAAHYSAGHHRLYFHSTTNIPIRPCEFDVDSEEEPDPDWLKNHIRKMLDEFTDVNDGEKPIMKLWNLYVMKHSCIADCQMADTCRAFLNTYGTAIHRLNLRRNLLLHLVNLVDFGVLKTSILLSLMQHFDRIAEKESKINRQSISNLTFAYRGKELVNGNSHRFVSMDESLHLSEKSARLERLQKIIDAAQTETIV